MSVTPLNQKLTDLLGGLTAALKDGPIKSKQAAFDLYASDIDKAKNFASWVQITNAINETAGSKFTVGVTRNMYLRAKAKSSATLPSQEKGNIGERQGTEKQDKEIHVSTVAPIKASERYNEWLSIGVSGERLISDLEANGYTPEQVASWKQLSEAAIRKHLTQLLNYDGKI
jgi:hypothetical protein